MLVANADMEAAPNSATPTAALTVKFICLIPYLIATSSFEPKIMRGVFAARRLRAFSISSIHPTIPISNSRAVLLRGNSCM
jgi:hypothetical protein